MNNNNSAAQNRNCSPERSLSPVTSYRGRSPSPSPYHTAGPGPMPPLAQAPQYTEIRSYGESTHLYRRPASQQLYEEEDRDSEKDSGLALNLSTDRAGSDGARDESGRSSASGTPPVSSSNIQDGSSSGDESGYPRSPNSSGDNSTHNLPHKLRFKSAVNEKEAVSSLLSLHQMAMIKREPTEHINSWIENAGGHAGLLASLLPCHPPSNGHPFPPMDQDRFQDEANGGGVEPSRKRIKLPLGHYPENIKDEVARLTSEVATLKNILVNRMKDEEGDEEDREEN